MKNLLRNCRKLLKSLGKITPPPPPPPLPALRHKCSFLYLKESLFFAVLFLSLDCGFFQKAYANPLDLPSTKPLRSMEEQQKKPAKGLIIAFKGWPLSEQNKSTLLKKAKALGLKEKASYSRFKIYVFEWKEYHTITYAQKACESFLDFPHLDYCEPDLLQKPAGMIRKKKKRDKKPRQAKLQSDLKLNSQGKSQNPIGEPIHPKKTGIYLYPPGKFSDNQTGNIRSCNIISSQVGPEDQSDYWAQEMIGSDLVREELSLHPPVQKNLVAVFDTTGQDRHDISVRNLISGEGRQAVLPEIGKNLTSFNNRFGSDEIEHIDNLLNPTEQKCFGINESQVPNNIVAYEDPYRQCQATHLPSFINRSLSWYGETTYHILRQISPPSILINSAGNDYPQPISIAETRASRDYNVIMVGSMSPTGIRSEFSQEGEAVHIMAPSDDSITSATATGAYKKFAGTSGAAPLVTGSLAGFEWAAGYHPTAEEAKILLEKTAIPTPYSNDNPRRNGVGMVNAYKLMMAGKKLKQACGKNISCFKDLIRKDDTYQFPEDPSLSKVVAEVFPRCSSTCTAESIQKQSSCADKANMFKELRKQAFLNPQDKELWKQMACVYATGGFRQNKDFALNIYNSLSGRPNRGSGDVIRSNVYCQKNTDCVLVAACGTGNKRWWSGGSSTGPGDGQAISRWEGSAEDRGSTSTGGSDPAQNTSHLLALNRASVEEHYLHCLASTGTIPLCNGKCRCDSQETITTNLPLPAEEQGTIGEPNGGSPPVASRVTYSASCVKFRCVRVLQTSSASSPAPQQKSVVEPENQPQPKTGSGGAMQ